MDPRGTDPRNQDLSDRRVSAVRNALIQAGGPVHKVEADALPYLAEGILPRRLTGA